MLAECVKSASLGAAFWIIPDDDVVARSVGGEKSVNTPRGEAFFGDDAFDEFQCLGVNFFRFFCSACVLGFESLRLGLPNAADFPCMEKGSPVDVIRELAQRLILDDTSAEKLRHGWLVVVPVASEFQRSSFL